MAYDLEEQEKIDALRAWWDRYGTLIAVVIIAAVLVFAGWRAWQWYQGHQAGQAMGYFEALETSAMQPTEDSLPRIKAASETLRQDFPDSGYTSRGVLIAAAALRSQGDLDGAREQLAWLVAQNKDPALVPLAKLRLAGILLEQQQYDQALAHLDAAPPAFAGLYADRRGDILIAQGKKDEAIQAWQTAITQLGDAPLAQVIQLKIDANGGA
ncbi:MAG TPA: tetratricopeptide repeat protein [Pusillimonas sp.]|uniref:YfgM family protein n=1 Tax=Pusillimonas sp. TaxID=3040095 RepID=UPI002C7A05DE|nr:tetratricopeptide repeat protein [Pusillimonas sp.]HUH87382.1 tetratricopeptide repeat protein [Pusillimonas sp.]